MITLNKKEKPKAGHGSSTDPQSLYARVSMDDLGKKHCYLCVVPIHEYSFLLNCRRGEKE